MKTIAKSLLFLLPVMILHTAEAAVQKGGNPYTVQAGDTLYDIAVAYYGQDNAGTKWRDIANANHIDPNNPIITVGQQLTIP